MKKSDAISLSSIMKGLFNARVNLIAKRVNGLLAKSEKQEHGVYDCYNTGKLTKLISYLHGKRDITRPTSFGE